LKSILKTVSVILNERPEIVAAQNPSILLALLAIMLKWFCGYKILIDAHNRGIYPLEGQSLPLMRISRWIQKNADLTLVTNEPLKAMVENSGGRAYVLPDKIPDLPSVGRLHLAGSINVAYICTFSVDEPYTEVLKAAGMLPLDICIYVTGNYEGAIDIASVSQNVRLLGFIPEQEYWSLISSVDIIMDLTVREECLVCGAYEGIALSKPLILSDTETTKSYFNKGCIYVRPIAASIAGGITQAIANYNALSSDIEVLKTSIDQDWKTRFFYLNMMIKSLCNH
jgi:glycosyltransferase involved in cell wall biosynthesis